MDSENDIKREETSGSDVEETDTASCCCYVAVPCGCDFDPCECDVEACCC